MKINNIIKKHLIAKVKILITINLTIILSGCGWITIGFNNLGETLFSSPEEIKSKVVQPVKPDIKLSALWIGHSSVLLQIYNKVILIDPVFNNVVSGVMMRRHTAAIDINAIEKLDMILISHAHMDHMSISTLADLDEKFKGVKLVFPKGAEEFLPGYDFDFIRMKTGNTKKKNFTGETKIIDSVKITAVFASHFGGRFGLDSYLWNMPGCTGYIIQYKDVTVFYAGDTLYDEDAYKKLGEKFNIDLAIIPIGPCRNCEETNNFNHVASNGALLMFDDLKAKYMIPVHYGALKYRTDPEYPLFVFKELVKKKINTTSLSGNENYSDKIKILGEGEQFVFEYIE